MTKEAGREVAGLVVEGERGSQQVNSANSLLLAGWLVWLFRSRYYLSFLSNETLTGLSYLSACRASLGVSLWLVDWPFWLLPVNCYLEWGTGRSVLSNPYKLQKTAMPLAWLVICRMPRKCMVMPWYDRRLVEIKYTGLSGLSTL